MPIQTGILPAGSTLTVDYSIGETATISYQDGDIGVVDNGQTAGTIRAIGPFANDAAYSVEYTGFPSIYTTAAGGAVTNIALQNIDPSMLAPGSSAYVSLYGGNIAVGVQGGYKYQLPFRTTWDNRPAANAVPSGTELQVTDYGSRKWISDGTYWVPAQGVIVLYDKFGLNDGAGHIAQISGSAAGTFAIPGGLKIPAGMIRRDTKISAQLELTKAGGNGTANATITLGTSNSASDGVMASLSVSAATGTQVFVSSAARFGSSATKFNTRNSLGEGVSQASSANVMQDRASSISTAADMWFNVNINSANAGDVFNLIGIQIKLES